MRRIVFAIGLCLPLVLGGQQAGTSPAISGELRGETTLFAAVPAFVLPWRLALAHDSNQGQAYMLRVDTSGTHVVVQGKLDPFSGNGTWTINESRLDAGTWFAAVRSVLGMRLSGASVEGEILVTGRGRIVGGKVSGVVHVEWRDGRITHPIEGWTLAGIAFSGAFSVNAEGWVFESTRPFHLSVATITHPRFGARNLVVEARVTAARTLQLEQARLEIAGGDLEADPCEIPLSPLDVDMNLRFTRVGLQDIVLLVPTAGLADARGRIDGVVRVKWSKAADFQLGLGKLTLHEDEPTTVRLSPTLGLLTGHVPQYIDLLPEGFGSLRRWLRTENPAFDDLKQVELGQSELRVTALEVQLTPDGDTTGRSARIHMVAQPGKSGTAVKQVTFDVNVAGPLNKVLKLGIEQNFSVKTQ